MLIMESTKSKTNIILVLTIEFHFSFFLCTIEITLNREMLLDCRIIFANIAWHFIYIGWNSERQKIEYRINLWFILYFLFWYYCGKFANNCWCISFFPFVHRSNTVYSFQKKWTFNGTVLWFEFLSYLFAV